MTNQMSAYMKTDSVTVTRTADVLTWVFSARPQAMSVYLRFVELGNINGVDWSDVVMISSIDQRFGIERHSSGNYTAVVKNAAGVSKISGLAAAPDLGDVVELLATLTADGKVQLTQSVNGATATTGTQSAALSVDQTWGDATLRLIPTEAIGVRDLCVVRGVQDLTTMRRLAGTDGK